MAFSDLSIEQQSSIAVEGVCALLIHARYDLHQDNLIFHSGQHH